MHRSDMSKIVPKVIIRIVVLVFLIVVIVSIVTITIKDLMEDVGDSGMYLTSLEYSYYSGEYGRLFSMLPGYDKRYTGEYSVYTEMALIYRTYEKYLFWNDIVARCENDDENLKYYENYRSRYLEELSRKMKSLKHEENRLIMDKIIRDAGIELI